MNQLRWLAYILIACSVLLAVTGVFLIGHAAGWWFASKPCKVRWQASSIEVVNGKATKPVVTQGCGRP